jgi:chemotaxis protein methyltransferase CheR
MPHHHGAVDESLCDRDFSRLCALIYAEAGICLSAEKKTMVEVRLRRRLRALNMASYEEYCQFVFSKQGMREELVFLIDVITTNKTDFFREAAHFDFLGARALPELVAAAQGGRQLVAWSAGCSTGEEPYTLAMALSEYAESHPGFRFRILATDISTAVLALAEQGIYTTETIKPVPRPLQRKYLMRSRDVERPRVRIIPELRRLIEFRRLNFMDSDYLLANQADVIFCRNVLIYFDRPTQENILRKLTRCLQPRGFLFVGHSETLHDMDLPLIPVAPAVYRRTDVLARY